MHLSLALDGGSLLDVFNDTILSSTKFLHCQTHHSCGKLILFASYCLHYSHCLYLQDEDLDMSPVDIDDALVIEDDDISDDEDDDQEDVCEF